MSKQLSVPSFWFVLTLLAWLLQPFDIESMGSSRYKHCISFSLSRQINRKSTNRERKTLTSLTLNIYNSQLKFSEIGCQIPLYGTIFLFILLIFFEQCLLNVANLQLLVNQAVPQLHLVSLSLDKRPIELCLQLISQEFEFRSQSHLPLVSFNKQVFNLHLSLFQNLFQLLKFLGKSQNNFFTLRSFIIFLDRLESFDSRICYRTKFHG